MKNLFLIINPVAGRGMYKNGLGEALHVLHSAGYVPTVRFTTRAGEAVELAQQSVGYDLVCCLGGDGTLLGGDLAGLMALKPEQRPPIGYFPLGTANDVATTLQPAEGRPRRRQRGASPGARRAWPGTWAAFGGDRCFTYVAAFGAFTDVSYETPQQIEAGAGPPRVPARGHEPPAPSLPHYRNCRVELDDGEVVEGDYIFGGVTNSTSVAGLVKACDPDMVALDDGEFEVALVKYPATLADLNALVSQAVSKNFNGEMMSIRKAHTVRFTFADPVPFTRDGEPGGVHTDVKIENAHSAVRIIV